MPDPKYMQENLIDTQDTFEIELPSTPPKKETNGSRISPSQIENLSNLYDIYKDSHDEKDFLNRIREEKPFEKEKTLENAKWSIYGTQLHQLQYFTQLFKRSGSLKRYPNLNDFKNTFPYREREYYEALLQLMDISDLENDNPSQTYWNEWRMNGQDFTPKRKSTYLIDPSTIRFLWENGTVPLKDIDTFNSNTKDIPEEKLNPEETLLINEVLSITNIFFNDCNLQVPTVIDEICIPTDFPRSPIHIVDYKTGKQFKQPLQKERVQIFLMMTSVLVNMYDRATSIKFKYSPWDIAHNTRDFPFFTKKNLDNTLRGGVYFNEIVKSSDVFNYGMTFSYVNPLTQESIDISTKDLALDKEDDIKDMLMYLNSINTFYTKYKDILKKITHSSSSPYTLPSFPIKNFNTNNNGYSRDVQLGMI